MDILGVGSKTCLTLAPEGLTDAAGVFEMTVSPLPVVTETLNTALKAGWSLHGKTVLASAGSRSVARTYSLPYFDL